MIPDGFDYLRLPNGLQLLGERSPARSVALGVMVDAGARDEAPEQSGISHFLEHLAFKGDGRWDALSLNRAFDAMGAHYNAYTSHERTFYYGAVLAERRAEFTDLLLSLLRPAFDAAELETERKVVLEEIAMYQDRPAARAFERASERFFNGHPMGGQVLGTQQSVSAISVDQVRAYHGDRYGTDRSLMVITGAYDWDQVVEQVAAVTAHWQPGHGRRSHPTFAPRRGQEAEDIPGIHRAHLCWYAPAPSTQDPERLAAALLAKVLGDADNGRLFWALVEPGLVDEASFFYDPADGLGTFQAYVSTGAERWQEVADVVEEVLERFQEEGPTEEEWARAQRGMATAVTLRSETPMGRLGGLADAWLDRGEVQTVQGAVQRWLSTGREEGMSLLATRPLDARYRFALRPRG